MHGLVVIGMEDQLTGLFPDAVRQTLDNLTSRIPLPVAARLFGTETLLFAAYPDLPQAQPT